MGFISLKIQIVVHVQQVSHAWVVIKRIPQVKGFWDIVKCWQWKFWTCTTLTFRNLLSRFPHGLACSHIPRCTGSELQFSYGQRQGSCALEIQIFLSDSEKSTDDAEISNALSTVNKYDLQRSHLSSSSFLFRFFLCIRYALIYIQVFCLKQGGLKGVL